MDSWKIKIITESDCCKHRFVTLNVGKRRKDYVCLLPEASEKAEYILCSKETCPIKINDKGDDNETT